MGHKTHVLAERQNQHALTCERGGKGFGTHCVWTYEHDDRLHLGLVNTKSGLGRQTICQLLRMGVIYVQSFEHRLERNDSCCGNNAGRPPTAAEHLPEADRKGIIGSLLYAWQA